MNINKEQFDWQTYLNNYNDLQKNGINTLDTAYKHWIIYGQNEGRTFHKIKSDNMTLRENERDVCYCYGNCQLDNISRQLEDHPILKSKYEFHYFYVVDSISKINKNLFQRTQLFIYQHVKSTSLSCTDTDLNPQLYTAEYIIQNYLPKSCVCISIPSIHFAAYWPDLMSSLEKYHEIAEEFPYIYTSKKLYELAINLDVSEEDIIQIIEDPFLISDIDIQRNYEAAYQNLCDRELQNNVDIPISQYLAENFKKIRLFNILNHPTLPTYNYIISKINEKLQLPHDDYILRNQKYVNFSRNIYRTPILKCVLRYFNFNDPSFDGPFFIHYKQFDTRQDFFLYYVRKIRTLLKQN